MKPDLAAFWELCHSRFTAETPAYTYLRSRGYADFDALVRSSDLGYYRGACRLPFQGTSLWAFLKRWEEVGNQEAVVFPLRSITGDLLGIQLAALKSGVYKTFTISEAKTRAVFFRPRSFDLGKVYRTGSVSIVEGCLDALSLGHFSSGTLGVLRAYVSETQQRELLRWVSKLYSSLDNDEVGDKAHNKLLYELGKELRIFRLKPVLKDSQDLFQRSPEQLRRWASEKLPKEMLLDVVHQD